MNLCAQTILLIKLLLIIVIYNNLFIFMYPNTNIIVLVHLHQACQNLKADMSQINEVYVGCREKERRKTSVQAFIEI